MIFPSNQSTHFVFAGIEFPHVLYSLPTETKLKRLMPANSLKKRLIERRRSRVGYYILSPVQETNECTFYLGSDFMPNLRWHFAGKEWRINDCESITGIVMRLPSNRGFLAGWTMGPNMASCVHYRIYDNEHEAALAANDIAENAANEEIEYQESERLAEQKGN